MKHIKYPVFLPPFLVLILSAIYSFIQPESFLDFTSSINTWILDGFGWLFSVAALCFLIICMVAYFSPLGKKRIGGEGAIPLLSKWKWFAITLCTTIATGILFWGTAEPLYHLYGPPSGLGIEANTQAAANFSMSTMYMHWSLIPYGIYTLGGLMFALMYYNEKQPFTLGSMLYPVLGDRANGKLGSIIDAVCLYTLVAGMAASLGTGILILAGGAESVLGIPYSRWSLGVITLLIVITFVLSAASGLMKGIRILSDFNLKIFIGIAIFVFIFGPTTQMLQQGGSGLLEFFTHFFDRSLIGVVGKGDAAWAKSWTIFYWANWLAWTPITALFLGRIARGYTVKEFIHYNLFFPSLFACLWMMIFSGTAISTDFHSLETPLYDVLNSNGGSSKVIFTILNDLPIPLLTSLLFLAVTFLSFVTAADSNTTAMSGISSHTGIGKDGKTSLSMKIIWGSLIGLVAYVMVAFSEKGIDGIKMLSNLGGFPALLLMIAVAVGMVKTIIKEWR